jgi:hypothetical protein
MEYFFERIEPKGLLEHRPGAKVNPTSMEIRYVIPTDPTSEQTRSCLCVQTTVGQLWQL